MSAPAGPDLLAAIVAGARRRVTVSAQRLPVAELERQVAARPPAKGRFRGAFVAGRLNVIAECKRRSPSRGILRADYDPVAVARGYAEAGATAISVLTEPTFFDGALEHLAAVRSAVSLPLLRKDFVVDRYQLVEARAAGADAVLLIVAALARDQLRALMRDAQALGLDALVEVHDEQELEVAVDSGATMIGVNNRNLRTLAVSIDASWRLISRMPNACIAVAESGLRSHEDLVALAARGYRGFLVGERLMTSPDPGMALRHLLGAVADQGRGMAPAS